MPELNLRDSGLAWIRKHVTAPRLSALLLLTALIPSAWVLWSNLDMPHLGFHDDGIYWTCSRSLAAGSGYRIAHLPGEPYQTKYPPLYPAYLSLAPTIAVASWATWLWLPAFALLSYFALEEFDLSRQVRLLISGTLLVHPVCVWASTHLLSELMFASLVMATGIAARRATSRPAFAVVAGALAASACLTRSAGLPLLIALPAFLFARTRSLRPALMSVCVMLPAVGLWHWWSTAHRDSRIAYQYYVDYFGWFAAEFGISDVPRLFVVNLRLLCRGLGNLALIGLPSGHDVISVAAALIACFGIARIVKRHRPGLLALFACGYVPLLLVWNFFPSERFLLPLLPPVMAGMFDVFGRIYRFGLPIAGAVTGLALLSVGGDLYQSARAINSEMDSASAWIESNTPGDARILTSFDVRLYLRTGRHAYRPALPVKFQYQPTASRCRSIAGIPDLCRREHIGYLLRLPHDDWFRVDDPDELRAVNSLLRLSFEPVFSDGTATVYRLADEGRRPLPAAE